MKKKTNLLKKKNNSKHSCHTSIFYLLCLIFQHSSLSLFIHFICLFIYYLSPYRECNLYKEIIFAYFVQFCNSAWHIIDTK